MVRGEFAVDEGIDDSLGERLYFVINEAIIYMLVAADAKIVAVVRASLVSRRKGVNVGKILGDRGVSLRRGPHIEVARDKHGTVILLSELLYQQRNRFGLTARLLLQIIMI